jgi:transcriptional regulator with XRE-family HTH domain
MSESEQSRLGRRIRELRKDRGLTMQQLSKMVGVNYTTIYRVETGKVSPSVVLLSEIAHRLGHSVVTLLQDERSQLTVIKTENQPVVDSDKMSLRLLVPQGLINDKISISLGKAEVGEFVSRHTTDGFELAYIIRGKCVFRYGGEDHELDEGDLVFFDGRTWHSVSAVEPLEFLAIYFRDLSTNDRHAFQEEGKT